MNESNRTLGRRPAFALLGKLLGVVATLALAVGLAPAVAAESAAALALEAVDVTTLPGDRVQLILRLSGPAPQPVSFTVDNPARIALDFRGVANALKQKTQNIGVGSARSVAVAEAGGRTRVVVNMVRLVPYETRLQGNEVVVILDGQGSGGVTPPVAGATPPAAKAAAPRRHEITDIDFRRGPGGEGRVMVRLADPATPIDMRLEGGKVLVDFMKVTLPPKLQRRLDVMDFATPVKQVETRAADGNVHMEIEAVGLFDHYAYQSGDQYIVEVKPLTKEEQEAVAKKAGFTGERLSLNFQDIDVRAVLQLIAEFTGLNIVVSDTVSGSITLRLNNVPWDQALDIVLKTKGLAMRQDGNVVMVAPAAEVASREQQEMQSQNQTQELAPLQSEYIQVNYAKVEELANLIKSKDTSLLSSRGAITIDQRTSTLLVRDTADRLDDIRKLVRRLDVPVRQVMIDSRIVVANDDFSRDLGVRFGVTGVKEAGSSLVTYTGSGEGADTMITSATGNLQSGGTPYPIALPDVANRFNVNLPVTSPAGRIGFAILGADYLLDLELSAMQSEGRGEVISNPRVITGNNQAATISQGQTTTFIARGTDTATQLSVPALLSLKVTPQVTPDDRILMTLDISDDRKGNDLVDRIIVDTRKINTTVLVSDGDTLVLGGIYQETSNNATTKVPGLGDIPVVGNLFRGNKQSRTKQELLVFVTPRIVKEAASGR